MVLDVLICIMTCITYMLSNGFTYDMLTKQPCGKPLRDVLHELLPDISHWVHVRDVVLIALMLPFLNVVCKCNFIIDLVQAFSLVVLIKAVSIFFTFIPPSNPHCETKKYVNHCFHSSTSGHAAIIVILAFLYVKYGVFTEQKELVIIVVFLYCLLILMTRAHYTVDVIQGVVVSVLIMVGGCKCIC